MATGEDAMTESLLSSLLRNWMDSSLASSRESSQESSRESSQEFTQESSQEVGSLPPEDVAWADSCLIKDPEVSDSEWDSLKDALLEILNVQPNSIDTSGAGNYPSPSRADVEILPSDDEPENALLPTTYDSPIPIPIDEMKEDYEDIPDNQKASNFQYGTRLENIFLPSYSEKQQSESRIADLSSLGDEIEPATDDIFKVWDLEIPAEEDELIQQLNKALTDSSLPSSVPASFDDWGKWNDSKGEPLADLISGIADLSLDKKAS